jgi:hypothetical protein
VSEIIFCPKVGGSTITIFVCHVRIFFST